LDVNDVRGHNAACDADGGSLSRAEAACALAIVFVDNGDRRGPKETMAFLGEHIQQERSCAA
jgi:hypothetical protein